LRQVTAGAEMRNGLLPWMERRVTLREGVLHEA
jgi:hypothetical protein